MALPMSMVAQIGLTSPTFPSPTTVRVSVTNAQPTSAYVIFSTNALTANFLGWPRVATGAVGQAVFDLPKSTNSSAFYAAADAGNTTPTVATPVFSPVGGAYPWPTNVSVTCATEGAAIYYTTNGNTPTTLDTYIYNGSSLRVASIVTFKAKAFKAGYNDSAIASATYTINSGPSVSAGTQQVLSSGPATLQGVVTDDGLTGTGTRFTNWSQISGPGTATFANSHQPNTTVSFDTDGIYVLQLAASDGQYTNSDQVTIAINSSLSVSLTAPSDGSMYSVPTNFLLQASASCGSGSVTQLVFYTGTKIIGQGVADGSVFSLNWKSVPAGAQALTAVAYTSDPNNYCLRSAPVNIIVDWPTNIGQVTLSLNDLQIPVAGSPISVNREYGSRYGISGAFGQNWRADYESIKIEKSTSLAQGWKGASSGINFWVVETTPHTYTVSLSDTEKYYFRSYAVFKPNDTTTYRGYQPPRYATGVRGRILFQQVGGSQVSLQLDNPSNMGYDDGYLGWTGADIRLVQGSRDYDPDFSSYTFTGPDGTIYRFNSSGGLYQKTDRNGNCLTYTDGGIQHSSGKQVVFTKDSGRITAIYDPNGLDSSGNPTGLAAITYSYDTVGNLTSVSRLVDRLKGTYATTSYAYTDSRFANNVTFVTNAAGVMTSGYEYDSNGRLSKQYDALNRATIYSYDLDGQRQVITDRLNNTTIQTYSDAGQLTSVQDAAGGMVQYGYDENGRKIAETNAEGSVITYTYNSTDQVTAVTNQVGSTTSATYNNYGQPLTVTDAMGNTTQNAYDDHGNQIATTNALQSVSLYAYDSQGNRTYETNAFGLPEQVVIANQYNQFGYLTNTSTLNAQSMALNTISYTYDANGNRLTERKSRTTSLGVVDSLTQWTYDAANRVVQTIDAVGATNITVYDLLGKQAQNIDALGRTNSYYYNTLGQLTNTTYANGLTESASYDAEGRKQQTVDRGGRTTTYIYDAVGRLTRTTYPDLSYTSSTYDLAGREVRIVQGSVPSGGGMIPISREIQQTRITYDPAGRRMTETNALGQGIEYTYDANGNQLTVTDPLGRTTTNVFDSLNRQTAILYPDGSKESYGYDGLGRRIALTNQAASVSLFGYDGLGRTISVTNAWGTTQQIVSQYRYDEVGNVTQQIDAAMHTNWFEYDGLGHRIKHIMPGNQTETFGYDLVGNLAYQTNCNNSIITNQYDSLNRLTNRTASNAYKVSYTYSTTDQRTSMTDGTGTTIYTYDNRDRLLTKSTSIGTLTYTYDIFGNLASIQTSTPNGTSVNYYYDPLNRLTNVVDRFGNSTFYGYDGCGNLQTTRYPNSVTNTYGYSTLNRLTNISVMSSAGSIASFAYRLASSGNRTNLVENISGILRTNRWSYDSLSRLTNEMLIGASYAGTVIYKYDAAGNRTNRTSTLSGVTNQVFSFNSNDQLASETYDSNGNVTGSSGSTYRYDVVNQLTNINNGAAVYVYDGDGNLFKRIVGTTTTYYLVDNLNPSGFTQVIEESASINSTPSQLYTYGLHLISIRESSGATHFYGFDGNGNTRFLTSSSGAITDTYLYDAFGDAITSTGTTTNVYRFAGEQFDPNCGFYYLRARFVNPNTGRFLSVDSQAGDMEDPITLHRYLYCRANPVNLVDPSGHDDFGFSYAVISVVGSHLIMMTSALTTSAATGAGRLGSSTFWAQYEKVNYVKYPPEQAVKFWQMVGGTLGTWGATPDKDGQIQESCATRMSWALNGAGLTIPSIRNVTWKNSDGKRYITRAGDMHSFLEKLWGPPDDSSSNQAGVTRILNKLSEGQCAIFSTKSSPGHTGVIKKGYEDPYVDQFSVDVWLLR